MEPLTPDLVAGIVTLHRTYYLVDVMLLYTILLGISPLALLLLHSGKSWLVLLLSVGLWLIQQLFPQQAEVPWPIANNPTFPVAAWQLWFFGGVIVGYHQEAIWRHLDRVPRRPALMALLLGVAALVYLRFTNGDRLAGVGGLADGTAALDLLFEKGNARVGRIVAFAIFFPFLYALLTYVWRPLSRLAGWLLIPFGQYALYVYVLHLFVVYLAALLLPLVPGFDRLTPWMNTPVHVVGILALWLLIRRRVLFDLIPR